MNYPIAQSNVSRKHVIFIFLIVLIDFFALGLIIPIITPMVVAPTSPLFFPLVLGFLSPKIVYGIIAASFSIAQFFTAPTLGSLSDRWGRKRVLMICIAGTALGYGITALGIFLEHIFLAGLGHFIHGVFAGTIAIAYSTLADISTDGNKAANFGLVGMAFGIGFTLGPLLGGMLASSDLVSWFSYLVPFTCSALICCLNFLFVWRFFPTKILQKVLPEVEKAPFRFLQNIVAIRRVFISEDFRDIFIVVFLSACGFTFFSQFIQLYLIEEFQFTQRYIGYLLGWLGIWLIITQGGIIRVLTKHFSLERTYLAAQILLAITFAVLLLPSEGSSLYVIIPFVAIGQGISLTTLATIISNRAAKYDQGKFLGVNQSMEALAQSIIPLIGGILATVQVELPMMCASFVCILVIVLFARQQKVV